MSPSSFSHLHTFCYLLHLHPHYLPIPSQSCFLSPPHIHRDPLPVISTRLLSPPHIHRAPLSPSYPQGSSLPLISTGLLSPSYPQGSSLPLISTEILSPSYPQGSSLPLIFKELLWLPRSSLARSTLTINSPTADSTDSSHWPYLGYLLTVTAYLWASCGAHAFCSLSLRARNVCYFVDYLALSVFSFGSATLYASYSFPRHLHDTRYEAVYLPVAAVISMACVVMACSSRSFAGHWSQKCLRILSFVLPYMWDNLPLVYRVSSEGLRNSTAGSLYLGQFLAMMLATFFYGTHIPERLAPGKFDCWGNSHNLLHLLGTLATELQRRAGLADMTARQGMYTPRLSGVTSLAAIVGVALTNTAVMAAFIVHLPQDKATRSH